MTFTLADFFLILFYAPFLIFGIAIVWGDRVYRAELKAQKEKELKKKLGYLGI